METVWADLPPDEAQGLDREAFEAHFREHARRVLESPNCALFVAEDEAAEPVGYVLVGGAQSALSPRPFGFVYDLWVAPQRRREGIARRLLDRAGVWCRAQGYAKVKLEVSTRNGAARALYESTGFVAERVYMGRRLSGPGEEARNRGRQVRKSST